jgi:HTH-type transcriptional regulator / antitoxin HigA
MSRPDIEGANISLITGNAGYKAALEQIAPYFDNEPLLGSADAIRFEQLIQTIQLYESHHFPDQPAAKVGPKPSAS